MSKTITTEMRLPKQTIDEVKAIAKLAGLSPESVIKLALATEVRRWQKVGADKTVPDDYEAGYQHGLRDGRDEGHNDQHNRQPEAVRVDAPVGRGKD